MSAKTVYPPANCPLCDGTGGLPSGLACDHIDHDGQRLKWIRHYQQTYPPCSVCRAPMVLPAAQRLGRHLTCG
jgi:putative intracellular protease/amidase